MCLRQTNSSIMEIAIVTGKATSLHLLEWMCVRVWQFARD
jgi:hypothetical protein